MVFNLSQQYFNASSQSYGFHSHVPHILHRNAFKHSPVSPVSYSSLAPNLSPLLQHITLPPNSQGI